MAKNDPKSVVSRRDLLKAGTAAAALAAAASILKAAETPSAAPSFQAAAPASQPVSLAPSQPLPLRPLGKTGAHVTAVNIGCGSVPPQRLLDRAYESGVRYFDTAASYGKGKSELEVGTWFERTGKRKDIFLVTKQGGSPADMVAKLDARLAALKTDYIDLYFLHGMDKPEPLQNGQFKEAAEKLKKTGKVRFVGFSCHEKRAPELLKAAAECGYINAVMFPYSPLLKDQAEKLNEAMDTCHKAGVGMIAMKSLRGIKKDATGKTIGDLSVQQAVIKAALSDERIATICSAMETFKQLDQNTAVARTFTKPMTTDELEEMRKAILALGMDYCPGCDACRNGLAMSHPHVHDLARYLSYYEQDGQRDLAREFYRLIPANALDVSADTLAAARNACALHVDYPAIFARATAKLA